MQKCYVVFSEKILEATPHKTVAVRSFTSYFTNHLNKQTRQAGHNWRSKEELISEALVLADQPGLPYIRVVRTMNTV